MKYKILFLSLSLFIGTFLKAQNSVQINVDARRSVGKLEPFWTSQIIHPTEFVLTGWGKIEPGVLSVLTAGKLNCG
jgi:hypothetical protein